jgi:biotin carboxyl carrier protein
MITFKPFAVLAMAFLALPVAWLTTPAALAHGDHDAPAQTASVAVPRVEAHSDVFELVGIVQAGVMKLYLDRYDSNEPVKGATIEIEASSAATNPPTVIKATAKVNDDGTYTWQDPALGKPGDWALTFTIVADKDTDLLSGNLKLGDDSSAHAHTWWENLVSPKVWGVGVALLVALAAAAAWWRRRAGKVGVSSVAALSPLAVGALALSLSILGTPQAAWAHGDHDAPAPSAGGNAPKRQSDGSVFMPKPSQRELEIRTAVAQTTDVARTIELNGRVVMDPSAGGRVQAAQGGRVEAASGGIPALGQAVRKGQVLAVVRPTVSPIEQANQAAIAAESRINLDNAKKRLARLEQLEGSVPQREIDAARTEVAALTERASLSRVSLTAAETLVAPVSGVVAAANVVAGQVVAPNEVLFEVVDPARLMVEALAYDTSVVNTLEKTAATAANGVAVPLALVGVGRVLREQALPLQFRVVAGKDTVQALPVLALGQPVVVKARSSVRVKAVALAAAALVKNPSNQDIVWVHTSAEIFTPKVVRWQAVDGATIAVTQGLAEGDRVVVRGASLVNQVR